MMMNAAELYSCFKTLISLLIIFIFRLVILGGPQSPQDPSGYANGQMLYSAVVISCFNMSAVLVAF